jgi:hypothetical protein
MPNPAWQSVQVGVGTTDGSGNVSVTKPTSLANGDLVVVVLALTSISSTPSCAGFTLRAQAAEFIDVTSQSIQTCVFTKIATGSEPASWTFNGPASTNCVWEAHRITDGVYDSSAINEEEPANTDIIAPTVTAPIANCIHFATFTGYDPMSCTPPSGYTERTDQAWFGNKAVLSSVTKVVAAGATGAITATYSTARYGSGISVIVKPPNTAPTAPTNNWVDGQYIRYTDAWTFDWDFNDPDSGDTQSAAYVRRRQYGTGTYEYWTGSAWSGTETKLTGHTSTFYNFSASNWALPGSGSNDYYISVKTEDAAGAASPYSTEKLVRYAALVSATIDLPVHSSTINDDTPTITWTYSQAQSLPQYSYRARIYRTSDNALVWDSGTLVSSAARSVDSGTTGTWSIGTALVNSTAYYATINLSDGSANAAGTDTNNFTTSFTPPAAPTITTDYHNDPPTVTVNITPTHNTGTFPNGTVTTVVERSIDGGTTWEEIREGTVAINATLVSVDDREMPLNTTVQYRAKVRYNP